MRRNGACWLARRSVGGLVAALPAVAVASCRTVHKSINCRGAVVSTSTLLGVAMCRHDRLISTQVPNGVASRFESDALVQPNVDQGRSEFSGVANLYYPDWMAGTRDVEQTLTRPEAPLGLKFIGGPRGDLAIAQKSLDEQRSRIGQPQKLKLRFVRTKVRRCGGPFV